MNAEHDRVILDGNEAAASVAYRLAEVIAIYPITPASPMGEWADEWSAKNRLNIWGHTPSVIEMQSEGGAAGAVHGAIQAGTLATTFTSSQGLLLMLPNMYKIAGELSPFVMHVAARAVATHALSIFGDQSDVMGARQTGFAMLCSNSVQEAHDFAAIAHAATFRTRLPFLHFFDGFRTSHELANIKYLPDDVLRAMIDNDLVAQYRRRAMTPDQPSIRGTAQNPDTYFQSREAVNNFYFQCPQILQETMDRFALKTGRVYHLFDYVGSPDADRVIVMMGSGAEVTQEMVEWLKARGQRVGVLKVRGYRPFSVIDFVKALPATTRKIAVLDRTKEPGGVGEPLYVDVIAALASARRSGDTKLDPIVTGGRYGLSSKEYTPAMAKAVFDELARKSPRNNFTVGIVDDVSGLSLDYDQELDIESDEVNRAVFYGLGADGTVSANKDTIKIIGSETNNFVQGYFVYDSKKSGSTTTSHLRFGPAPLRSAYLIRQAGFIGCHQFNFIDKFDVLECAAPGAVFLLNSPYAAADVWDHVPREMQEQIIARKIQFHVIDAYRVAREAGLGGRINTIMQTCFFALSGILPRDQAIARIKSAIAKSYSRKGEQIIQMNFKAVDRAMLNLQEVAVPEKPTSKHGRPPTVSAAAPDFVRRVTAMMLANQGDRLPVSAFPVDGCWPSATTKWEKRNLAAAIPMWEPDLCIQCNKCVIGCPHAAIRAQLAHPEDLSNAPAGFLRVNYKAPDFQGYQYTLQVAVEDCTGCGLCVAVCPAKDKTSPRRKAINMTPKPDDIKPLRDNYSFFLNLPEVDRAKLRLDVKGSQFLTPLFEYSGACAGCGETPYLKLLSQLFGDRALIANATGCSSIYGGNLPTTPYATNREGRGPAWCNSLFEDNAEFGLGMRLAVDHLSHQAKEMVRELAPRLGPLAEEILGADQSAAAGIIQQRQRVAALRQALQSMSDTPVKRLETLADYLVNKSVWIVGGDGWAYDIGYGGLDHVLASGMNVKILVLDTEVYSNTGGQASKATPRGAAAKFAIRGKTTAKKDLGLMAMSYGNVYVAKVALGAKDVQTVKAFIEAESYHGPAIIIAYSACIAHGYDLSCSADHQRMAVESGFWQLYRYDPRRAAQGENPLQLDSPAPKLPLEQFVQEENRFRIVDQADPAGFKKTLETARKEFAARTNLYQQMAQFHSVDSPAGNGHPPTGGNPTPLVKPEDPKLAPQAERK